MEGIWDRWLASYELAGDADAALWGPLARCAGARVTSVSGFGVRALVQARLTYLQALDRDDLVAMLAENGCITEDDLRGGDGWRSRLLGSRDLRGTLLLSDLSS